MRSLHFIELHLRSIDFKQNLLTLHHWPSIHSFPYRDYYEILEKCSEKYSFQESFEKLKWFWYPGKVDIEKP